jgi:hypothetical protein
MNGKEVPYINTGKQIQFIKHLPRAKIVFIYTTIQPKQAFIFLGSEDVQMMYKSDKVGTLAIVS